MPVGEEEEVEINSKSAADSYLGELFEIPENRAIDVLLDRAKDVNDEYKEYFINRGTEILRTDYNII
jgi:hypothetical protein